MILSWPGISMLTPYLLQDLAMRLSSKISVECCLALPPFIFNVIFFIFPFFFHNNPRSFRARTGTGAKAQSLPPARHRKILAYLSDSLARSI